MKPMQNFLQFPSLTIAKKLIGSRLNDVRKKMAETVIGKAVIKKAVGSVVDWLKAP